MSLKAQFEKIVNVPGSSFLVRTISRPERSALKGNWHHHPEIEICLTLKSNGKRFVGSDISDYSRGDLVLLGENLPHCWITREACEQIVIQFAPEFLGDKFFEIPEMKKVDHLLEKSKCGLAFTGSTRELCEQRIISLQQETGFNKLIALFELLNILAESEEYYHLTSVAYNQSPGLNASKRIQLVYDYILNNYDKRVTIDEASSLLNMSKSSFCKFIKKTIKKTFSQLTYEVKISQACKLLIETDKYVSEISYLSGFEDAANFTRKFKSIMGLNPQKYREKFSPH